MEEPSAFNPPGSQKDASQVPGSLGKFLCFLCHLVCLCEQKFQELEEAHLRQMKQLIKGYSHSVEDTHVQVGQVG